MEWVEDEAFGAGKEIISIGRAGGGAAARAMNKKSKVYHRAEANTYGHTNERCLA